MDQIDSIRKIIKETNKYEDLYNLPLILYKSSNLLAEHSKDLSIGIFNVPCGGFGDVILYQKHLMII